MGAIEIWLSVYLPERNFIKDGRLEKRILSVSINKETGWPGQKEMFIDIRERVIKLSVKRLT
jgi:hypothetical protein